VTFFCPICFKKIEKEQKICPYCHTDITKWEKETPYESKLIHALRHPISEARMGAIITLGNIGSSDSAVPLAKCALFYPNDMVQNLAILYALRKISLSSEKNEAFKLLQNHPSAYIRQKATLYLKK
jgi:HEAT repeat protein